MNLAIQAIESKITEAYNIIIQTETMNDAKIHSMHEHLLQSVKTVKAAPTSEKLKALKSMASNWMAYSATVGLEKTIELETSKNEQSSDYDSEN